MCAIGKKEKNVPEMQCFIKCSRTTAQLCKMKSTIIKEVKSYSIPFKDLISCPHHKNCLSKVKSIRCQPTKSYYFPLMLGSLEFQQLDGILTFPVLFTQTVDFLLCCFKLT